MPSDSERACFEAGIKLGALYHQFVGAPFDRDSRESLRRAIEKSVESQRYVVDARVEIDEPEFNRYGYAELEGTMLDVSLDVEVGDAVVTASLAEDDGYPSMQVDGVST
ncbi:MAG: dihydroneopterin aldolase family protein [Halobacteriales archaeon]